MNTWPSFGLMQTSHQHVAGTTRTQRNIGWANGQIKKRYKPHRHVPIGLNKQRQETIDTIMKFLNRGFTRNLKTVWIRCSFVNQIDKNFYGLRALRVE